MTIDINRLTRVDFILFLTRTNKYNKDINRQYTYKKLFIWFFSIT